jgi:hypothetical protein
MIKRVTETKKLCDVCGGDKNVYGKCCICNKDICFDCAKKEMFMPTSNPCRLCWEKYPILQEIRKKYIKKFYALGEKEGEYMRKMAMIKKIKEIKQ